jgi:hypothetical protein
MKLCSNEGRPLDWHGVDPDSSSDVEARRFTMWLVWLIAVAVICVIIAVIILGVRGGKDLRRKP